MSSPLLIFLGLLSARAHAATVLYCVDGVKGTDAMADALAAGPHTVTTSTDLEGDCDPQIGSGAWDVVVVAVQAGGPYAMPELDAWVAAGNPTIYQDVAIATDASAASAWGVSVGTPNPSTLGSFDSTVDAGIGADIAMDAGVGWATWAWSMAGTGTTLASFEDGNAGAILRGSLIVNGLTTDAATPSSESDLARLFANEVDLLASPLTDGDGDGYNAQINDCNDTSAAINPAATETWYDSVDEDCSGGSDFDQDGDGYDDEGHGGDDCDDLDPSRSPGTAENVANAIDDDCDGFTDEDPNDQDGDGLTDAVEARLGTNAWSGDTDGDGMLDPDEVDEHTDPLDRDTDDDGLSDGAEFNVYLCDPLVQDSDGDTLGDALEVARTYGTDDTEGGFFVPDSDPSTTTDPTDADSDDDGISDGDEDLDGNGEQGNDETRPDVADSDADFVLDGTEIGLSAAESTDTDPTVFVADADPASTTDPLDADTDGGTIKDGTEDTNKNGKVDALECDPNNADDDMSCQDDDSDGLSNTAEAGFGTNPADADSDDDGLDDGLEVNTSTDPLKKDTDGDGLIDGAEDANKNGGVDAGETDPRLADTDGGGVNDGTEVFSGMNPLDPSDDAASDTGSPADTGASQPTWVYAGRGCDSTGSGSLIGMGSVLAGLLVGRRRR